MSARVATRQKAGPPAKAAASVSESKPKEIVKESSLCILQRRDVQEFCKF
jgi:hypothetical protein